MTTHRAASDARAKKITLALTTISARAKPLLDKQQFFSFDALGEDMHEIKSGVKSNQK
jgi:hypothetical protein|tara:strand:- start:767 stop:940 length:174 start_codon:yes stop_codon:yes gene_type:complete